jgi:hypothetical protein
MVAADDSPFENQNKAAKRPCGTHSRRNRGKQLEGESKDFHLCQLTQCNGVNGVFFLVLTNERGN